MGVAGALGRTDGGVAVPGRRGMDGFALRRLQELLGIVPLGVFLVFHLYENSRALQGPAPYDRLIGYLDRLPYLVPLEIVFLYLPILLHGLIGLHIAVTPRLTLGRFPTGRNANFYLQRATGVVAFAFLAYHVVTLRLIPGWSGGRASFALVAAELHRLPVMLGYALGVTCIAYHLANGLWSFAVHMGITVGPTAQRMMAYGSGILFLVLALVGARILAAFG